jgi:uncharacterized repeat protein (TIGR03803 family)
LKNFDDINGRSPKANFIQATDGKLYSMTSAGGSSGVGVIFSYDPANGTYTKLKDFDKTNGKNASGNLIQANNSKLYGLALNGGVADFGVIFSFDPSGSIFNKLKDFGANEGGSIVSASLVLAANKKLYGMTHDGGAIGAGVIFSYELSTNTYTQLKDFANNDGRNPYGGVMQANDGKLYGMTTYGGSADAGVIFSYDPNNLAYTKLKDLDSVNGAHPYGNLVQARDGKLYGMTAGGGSYGAGTIFSFDPLSAGFKKLRDFDNTNGARPWGTLVQAGDGKLYGMTHEGGTNGTGVIFSFDPLSVIYTKLRDLDSYNGAGPYGSLIQAIDGKLYGMTHEGGSNGLGVIFNFDPSISIYSKLKDFEGNDGSAPYGNLMQASDGRLYGMTHEGGSRNLGVIFSFDPSSSRYTKLKDYNGANGASPYYGSAFIQVKECDTFTTYYSDADGDGYGNLADSTRACSQPAGYVTSNTDCNDTNPAIYPGAAEVCNGIDDNCNGQVDEGLVFTTYYADADADGYGTGAGQLLCNNPGSDYSSMAGDCDDTRGSIHPGAPEICGNGMDDNCNGQVDENCPNISRAALFGVTAGGGTKGGGAIIKFKPATNDLTVLKSFESIAYDPANGKLLQASDGKLYGMTAQGGSSDVGVIFSFNPLDGTYTKLKDFDNANGANPRGGLILASDGKMYGMTSSGGSSGNGVIFSYDQSTSVYTKLVDFDYANGGNPRGSLIQAKDGKLYGMTYSGGIGRFGVIFSFDPSSSTYIKLKDFDGTNGGFSFGSLIQSRDGKMYGLASQGGSNDLGVIFSFDPATSNYTKLKDLDESTGTHPNGSLMQASNGELYGMTIAGGRSGDDAGTIFSFNPNTSTFTVLVDFDVSNGAHADGNLMQESDGKIYGMASQGGSTNGGVIFSFDISTSTYTKLKDFGNDSNPRGELMEATNGKLYGILAGGRGVIFSFDPSDKNYTNLKDFSTNEDGFVASAGLIQASNGKLYGTTILGGDSGVGVIFSYNLSNSAYTKLKDFDGINGSFSSRQPYTGKQWKALWNDRCWGKPGSWSNFFV